MVGRWAVTDTPGAATRPSRTDSAISRGETAQARSPARPPRSELLRSLSRPPRASSASADRTNDQCALTCSLSTFTCAILEGERLSLWAPAGSPLPVADQSARVLRRSPSSHDFSPWNGHAELVGTEGVLSRWISEILRIFGARCLVEKD